MNEYRITKYNPALRDERGAYTKNEWISYKQIGESFDGVILTHNEYKRVAQAYVTAAFAFLKEGGVTSFRVEGLEIRSTQLSFAEGSVLTLEQVGDIIDGLLREEFWCRLQGAGGFVHIGWDHYMFVGVPHACPSAEARAVELGLFVEEFRSPYHGED
jgi:hypothetical protein